MQAIVLNNNFEVVGEVDSFSSFIWTERYCGYGDLEIETEATLESLSIYQLGYYIALKDRNKLMYIEEQTISIDSNNGRKLILSGKSLEYLLNRRIIWNETVISGNFQNGIMKLINENIISPTDTARKIPLFTFKYSTDTNITSLDFDEEAKYHGDSLYTVIENKCNEKNIGFRVVFADDQFQFELYSGKNRTYDQTDLSTIVFSPEFGNLISSKYYISNVKYKNVALVVGKEEELEDGSITQPTATVGEGSGIDRFEVYVNMTNFSKTVDGEEISNAEYISQLTSEGQKSLNEVKDRDTLDAEIDYDTQFKYGIDYDIGDILEVENELGIRMKVRITEMIIAQDASGYHVNPSFIPIDE